MTYTYVRYFDDADLHELRARADLLDRDLAERRPHISIEAASAMRTRIDVLHAAIKLLAEPVPRPFE